jgi:hypothetical protein
LKQYQVNERSSYNTLQILASDALEGRETGQPGCAERDYLEQF